MKPGWKYALTAIATALLIAVFVDLARSMMRPPASTGGNATGQVYHGSEWSLAEHRGKTPVLMSFFATWCGPCRMEYPHLLEMQKKYAAKGVKIVLLTEEDATTIDQDAEYSKSPLTIVTDAGEAFKTYNVNGIPRTILLNARGDVELDLEGYNDAGMAQIEAFFSKL